MRPTPPTRIVNKIGLTIETRPDFINKEEIKFLRNLGVTRIELGAQTTNNRILKHINRGHSTKEIISATYLLKEAGFKITYHLMPGLPKSTYNKDITMLTNIFTKEEYKPDNIKFYPTSVVKFSPLQKIFQDGQYKPYSEKTLTKLILEFKKNIVPPWVRIQRLVRDLTTNDIVHNTFPSNLRQKLEKELKAQNIICPCIRCREIKYQTPHKALKLNTIKYNAASGTEYFLEYLDSNNNLYGLLRLRIPQFLINKKAPPLPELKNAALVRELHIYGQVAPIGQATTTKKAQHQGLGQKLLKQAQIIAKKHNAQNIAVISGIGARGYYQKLGYTLKGTYMVKNLTNTKN
jgi:elongator complex protein 3